MLLSSNFQTLLGTTLVLSLRKHPFCIRLGIPFYSDFQNMLGTNSSLIGHYWTPIDLRKRPFLAAKLLSDPETHAHSLGFQKYKAVVLLVKKALQYISSAM
jgi:hypothetical protein